MENSIYGSIYADVSYGKNHHFHDERVGFNVDFKYQDLHEMKEFSDFVERDHRGNGKGLYRVAVGDNINDWGERGVVAMSFNSGTVLNQYLQNFVLWNNMNVTLDPQVKAMALSNKYDYQTTRVVLAKLAEMRMAYVQNHTQNAGIER